MIIHCLPIMSSAQQIDIFEPAILECEYYKRMVTDTLDRENDFKADYVRLRIGKQSSMFYSPKDLSYDSLSYDKLAKARLFLECSKKNLPSPGGLFRERLYKHYPSGKITVFNHFALMHWTYTEDWEKPQWELLDSAKTILDYPCQLAVSQYRGRTWYAWFTFEIPISDGPWKLCGLPGLILEAQDAHKDYTFTITGLWQKDIEPVGIYNYAEYDWAKTTRSLFLQTLYKEIHTDQAARARQMYGLKEGRAEKTELRHRNYELEETDYPHGK